jgi:hypothetical protein
MEMNMILMIIAIIILLFIIGAFVYAGYAGKEGFKIVGRTTAKEGVDGTMMKPKAR